MEGVKDLVTKSSERENGKVIFYGHNHISNEILSEFHLRLRERTHPNAKLVIWGHSLGSGVTAKLGSVLSSSDLGNPSAYVLESPFSSLLDEIKSFYVSTFLPFDISNQLRLANLEFDSNSNLKKIKEPVLILHAKDDKVKLWNYCFTQHF
jgi:alpha-beta hydrolase superfamily lysophospholipase